MNMNWCFAAWGFKEMKLPNYLDVAQSMDVEYVEMHCLGTRPLKLKFDFDIPLTIRVDLPVHELEAIRKMCTDKGVKIVVLATGNDFLTEDPQELERNVKSVYEYVDLAVKLDVGLVRLLPYAGWPEQAPTEKTFEQVSSAFRDAGSYAESNGVALAIENHGGVTASVQNIRKLFAMTDCKAVGLNFDPANFHACGEDPLHVIDELAQDFVYCHLKDCRTPEPEPQFCAVGDGVLDYAQIIEKLKKVYDGYLAIEYERVEDVVDGTRRSLDYLRTLE